MDNEIVRDENYWRIMDEAHNQIPELVKRIATLEQQVNELEEANSLLSDAFDGERMRAEKLEAERAALVTALERYGRHDAFCATGRMPFDTLECDCGFAAAVRGDPAQS